jgi:N4-gp56 family major capsid protein
MAWPVYNTPNSPNISTDTTWTPEVWDLEIRREALPLFVFRQFARDVRSSYPGDDTTLKILKTSTVSTAGTTLAAGTEVPRTGFDVATVAYSPAEYGNAISPEKRILRMTPFAQQEEIRSLLARDAAKQLDIAVRNTLVAGITAGANSFNMGAGGTTIGTTVPSVGGTVATSAPSYRMTAYGVWAAVDYLSAQNAPKISRAGVGEGYIGILHPYQARGIKRDSQFRSAIEYASSNKLFNNEIGFWEGVYWIETTQGYYQSAVTAAYCALVFGAQCFGEYTITDLSYRRDIDSDFQRQEHHAWYCDTGWAIEYSNYLTGIWSLTGSP